MADGSVGWCAMINCDGGYITAFLDQEVGRTMYPDLQAGTAATATPTGQALRVPGGYRVSGRFPFASGCHHSRMGLAWLCRHGRWSAACGRQRCAGNPAVHGEAVAMRDSRHVVHDRDCAVRAAMIFSSKTCLSRLNTHSAFRTRS